MVGTTYSNFSVDTNRIYFLIESPYQQICAFNIRLIDLGNYCYYLPSILLVGFLLIDNWLVNNALD